MKLYLVRLDKNREVYFCNYRLAKRYVRETDFQSRYSISCDNSIDYEEDNLGRHKIEKIEIPDTKKYNYIYGYISMSLDKNNYTYQINVHPIELEDTLKTGGNYSIVRRDKGGDLKSMSSITIEEEQGFMELELYIPVGIYTESITGEIIKERLIKKIRKQRNIWYSKNSEKSKFNRELLSLKKEMEEYLGGDKTKIGLSNELVDNLLNLLNREENYLDKLEKLKRIISVIKEVGEFSRDRFLYEIIYRLI